MLNIILTILGISLLIFVHELGHYICARMVGVHVHVFSLGFGRRLWGFERNGTDYRISMMPLGGYVQVAGDDPTVDRSQLRPMDLHSKSFLARTLFYSGGVAMNLLFALIAFPLVFSSGVNFDAPVIGHVILGHPAWEAGLEAGDRLVSIGDKELHNFNSLRPEIALTRSNTSVELKIERDGVQSTFTIHPRYISPPGLRMIGVQPAIAPGPFELEVIARSAAHEAGVRSGDILEQIDGKAILDGESYTNALADAENNKQIRIKVRREATSGETDSGELLDFEFKLSLREDKIPVLGVRGLRTMIVGRRNGNTAFDALGLQRGDRVIQIQGVPYVGGTLSPDTSDAETVWLVEREGSDEPITLRAKLSAEQRSSLDSEFAVSDGYARIDRIGPVFVAPSDDSPAGRAGVQAGDEILSINGEKITSWRDLRSAVHNSRDTKTKRVKSLRIVIRRGGSQITLDVEPEVRADFGFRAITSNLQTTFRTETVGESLAAGCEASMDFVKQVYMTLKRMFTGEVSSKNLGGIISISRVAHRSATKGMASLFYLLAILSINLAVINVLPIPILDGGHLMFLLIEKVKGSPISTRIHNYSQILGLVFILALLVYVTYNDILKLF